MSVSGKGMCTTHILPRHMHINITIAHPEEKRTLIWTSTSTPIKLHRPLKSKTAGECPCLAPPNHKPQHRTFLSGQVLSSHRNPNFFKLLAL